MSITLRDVAKHCGLSPSTVSGVLNNRSGTWASTETRLRIQNAAEELGYRPNSAARALRTGRTLVVGFIYHAAPPRQHMTFDGAAEIIAAALGERGYELKLHVYPNQEEVMNGLRDLVNSQSCDAVVLVGRESDVIEQGIFLEQNKMPFIVKGRHEHSAPHWLQVDYDHEGMMRQAVAHLMAQGHQKIGYIGYDGHEHYQCRLKEGFKTAVSDLLGNAAREDWMIIRSRDRKELLPRLEEWFRQSSIDIPDAVVIGTDGEDWYILERFLALRGITIGDNPGQFAVAGQATYSPHLAYGRGHYFLDITYASIAEITVHDLLLPLLSGESPEPTIRRILPELAPTDGLELPLPVLLTG